MKLLASFLIIWLPFSIAAIAAVPVLLYGFLTDDSSIWKPVGRAMDKLLGERFKVKTLFDCIPGLYLRKIVRQEGMKWTCNSHLI